MSSLINFIWNCDNNEINNETVKRHESNSISQFHDGTSSDEIAPDSHINRPTDDMNWNRSSINISHLQNGFSLSSLSSYTIEDQDINTSMLLEDSTVQEEDDFNLTFEYLNDAWPIRAGDWKNPSDNRIFIETNSSDKDISLSLKDECEMIKKSVRDRLCLTQNEEPTLQQLFDIYFGIDSPMTACVIISNQGIFGCYVARASNNGLNGLVTAGFILATF